MTTCYPREVTSAVATGGPRGESEAGWAQALTTAQVAAHPVPPYPHSDEDPEAAVLPKEKLVSLCKCDPVLKWMRSCDHILYQALVEILIPDVLRPVPSKQPPPRLLSPSPCPRPPRPVQGRCRTTWGAQNPGRAVAQAPRKMLTLARMFSLSLAQGEKEGGPRRWLR